MTDTEINETIAEAVGYDFDPAEAHEWKSRGRWVATPNGNLIFRYSIPKYCSDLNAIHDAIAYYSIVKASDPVSFYEAFSKNLVLAMGYQLGNMITFCDAGFISNATARQRAEAFLRTIGKWRPS